MGERTAEYRRPTSIQVCLQVALVCACIVILFFGLAITAMGLWGYQSSKSYLTITDNDPDLTRLPFSMMVTGAFVAILGLVGVTGSIFSRTITGQTLLGVFSFVLVLVIISEVGAGAAAIQLKFNIGDIFINAAVKSQMQYNSSTTMAHQWDEFQLEYRCCGARGYDLAKKNPPYYNVFRNESVPTSCCKMPDSEHCKMYALNFTEHSENLYQTGCPETVIGKLRTKTLVIAVIAIVVGSTQLLAVMLAVVVVYMSSRLDTDKVSYSYNQLLQQDETQETGQTATATDT